MPHNAEADKARSLIPWTGLSLSETPRGTDYSSGRNKPVPRMAARRPLRLVSAPIAASTRRHAMGFKIGRRTMLLSGLGLVAAGHARWAAMAATRAIAAAQDFYDVRNYGAVGDGKALDTAAVNRAIDAAAAAGGGTVLVPAGSYLCFSIRLKSLVHLVLEQGATIIAADSPRPGQTTGYMGGTYDAAEPDTAWVHFQDYGH